MLGHFYADSFQARIEEAKDILIELDFAVKGYCNQTGDKSPFEKKDRRRVYFIVNERKVDDKKDLKEEFPFDIIFFRKIAIIAKRHAGIKDKKSHNPSEVRVRERIFIACKKCGNYPRLYEPSEQTKRGKWRVTCSCGRSTNLHASFNSAALGWNNDKRILQNWIDKEHIKYQESFDYDTFQPEPSDFWASIATSEPVNNTARLVTIPGWTL